MVFMDPSLRTRTSFETAMFLHGGHAHGARAGEGKLVAGDRARRGDGRRHGRAHHRRGAGAGALRRRARRCGPFPGATTGRSRGSDDVIRNFAQYCEKPVINLESARRHPCQALADAMTLREKLGETAGKRFVLTWAWHPKALPTAVPASAALAAAQLGMEIVIARPDGYELDPEDTALIRKIAQQSRRRVRPHHRRSRRRDGGRRCGLREVVGLGEAVTASRRRRRLARGAARLAAHRRRGCKSTRGGKGIVMHCLPVRRNVEIDDAVLDGPNSWWWIRRRTGCTCSGRCCWS